MVVNEISQAHIVRVPVLAPALVPAMLICNPFESSNFKIVHDCKGTPLSFPQDLATALYFQAKMYSWCRCHKTSSSSLIHVAELFEYKF